MTSTTHDGSEEPQEGGTTAEQLDYRLRQQRLAMEFGLFALRTHAVDELLQEATRVTAIGLRSRFSKVLEYLREEGDFLVRAGVGWKPGVVGRARIGDESESPAGHAFETGQPVISNHLASEDRFNTPPLLIEHGVVRAINVLIRGDGEKFGVLEVDSPDQGKFTEADSDFLQAFANLLGVALERKLAEEALRTKERLLEESLKQQEVLLVEIGHRVKNSLGIVASLLRMQGRLSGDANLIRALADAETRVQAVAHVHDRLWRKSEVRTVRLDEFLAELCERFAATGPTHTLHCNADPVVVSSDRAVSIGLLANELITNAFKYAYQDTSGEVELSVRSIAPNRLRLEVQDHGVGFPQRCTVGTSASLGIKLIATLSQQLGGDPKWLNGNPGTRFELEFSN